MEDLLKLRLITNFKIYWRGLHNSMAQDSSEYDHDWYYLKLVEIIDLLDLVYPNLDTMRLRKLARDYRYGFKEKKQ